MNNISAELVTPRLVVRISQESDLPKLEELYVAFCRHMEPLNGNSSWHEGDVSRSLRDGDLPPNGEKARYQHMSITRQSERDIIGFVELYNGYPTDEIYYIGAIYLEPRTQKSGFGKEVVSALIHDAAQQGCSLFRVCVDVKNWPALHFWYAQGFNTITKVSGDKILGQNNFMKLELEHDSTKNVPLLPARSKNKAL